MVQFKGSVDLFSDHTKGPAGLEDMQLKRLVQYLFQCQSSPTSISFIVKCKELLPEFFKLPGALVTFCCFEVFLCASSLNVPLGTSVPIGLERRLEVRIPEVWELESNLKK